MYDKVSTDLKFVDREKEVLSFWKENHVFEKSVELPPTPSSTAPPRPTASPTSATC